MKEYFLKGTINMTFRMVVNLWEEEKVWDRGHIGSYQVVF